MSERYDEIGVGYSTRRKADARIFRQIQAVLGTSKSVLNVGAGTGSYEPTSIPTAAVEPSLEMIEQRRNRSNVVQGVAEALPFKDASFDASLAVLTVHHWADPNRGLQECARCAKGMVVILTWDPASPGFWLTQEYFPAILEVDRTIFPSLDELRRCLGQITVTDVPIPADCVDGFLGAYWQKPEAYLNEQVRSAISGFWRIPTVTDGLERLRADLGSGAWHAAHGELLSRERLDLGYRLITALLE